MDKRKPKKDETFRIKQPLFYQDLFAKKSKSDVDFTKLSEKQLYKNAIYPEARTILTKQYHHNPSLWLHEFHHCQIGIMKQSLRKLIGRQTLHSLSQQKYRPTSSPSILFDTITHKHLEQIAKTTIYYKEQDIVHIQSAAIINNDPSTEENKQNVEDVNDKNDIKDNDDSIKQNKNIFAINSDCIDVGCLLQNRGYDPIILNMANENHAGGGWERGSGAQEENLFRRTSYAASLCNTIHSFQPKHLLHKKRKWCYPITEFGCIYSPNVFVLRSNEATGYKYLKCPYTLSFIAAAMYRFPKIDAVTRRYLDKDMEENVKKKIRSLLRVSYVNGHNCCVMSAWGCGAFRNPPEHQALLWHQVLMEKEFQNAFECIVFAILDDHNANKKHNPNGNYQPFADVFGESKLLELY